MREAVAREMPGVGFAELEVVANAMLAAPSEPSITFSITNPSQKMSRNGLTSSISILITMGLSKAREVGQFVESMALLDPHFPERLKAGFVGEYVRLRGNGLEGDALFESLFQFSSQGSSDMKKRATGLAVLTYLFEKCEVFEP